VGGLQGGGEGGRGKWGGEVCVGGGRGGQLVWGNGEEELNDRTRVSAPTTANGGKGGITSMRGAILGQKEKENTLITNCE